eukprot:gene8704-biopygen6055
MASPGKALPFLPLEEEEHIRVPESLRTLQVLIPVLEVPRALDDAPSHYAVDPHKSCCVALLRAARCRSAPHGAAPC